MKLGFKPLLASVLALVALFLYSDAHAMFFGGRFRWRRPPRIAIPMAPQHVPISPACGDSSRQAAQFADQAGQAAQDARNVANALAAREELAGLLDAAHKATVDPITAGLAAIKELYEKASEALEPLGGLKGAPQKKFNRGAATYMKALKTLLRVMTAAKMLRNVAFKPKDDATLDHLIAVMMRANQIKTELAPENPPPALELEMSLQGVSEEFGNTYQSAKTALGDVFREAQKYLGATASLLNARAQAALRKAGVDKLKPVAESAKEGLVAIMNAVVDISEAQSGQGPAPDADGDAPAPAPADGDAPAPKPAPAADGDAADPCVSAECTQSSPPAPKPAPPPEDQNEGDQAPAPKPAEPEAAPEGGGGK
jgi:hypothetical protein